MSKVDPLRLFWQVLVVGVVIISLMIVAAMIWMISTNNWLGIGGIGMMGIFWALFAWFALHEAYKELNGDRES